ncbi:MAG: hypothetical protein JXB04_09010 [Kiritimatiellae bacterium]|nr:hypothetical protein [Kiritimatiellia bacterium]
MKFRTATFLTFLLSAAACLGATNDDLVFIHHSCGANWLGNSLNAALVAKDYIDERNDITYGTALSPDTGRPASLGGTPGDNTNMDHWIRWFNDYLLNVMVYGCANGTNRIIMFKSCYPISGVSSDGTDPGDPFSASQTLANYKAVYRHLYGGNYTNGGYVYLPLEDVFAAHPEILFIPVTAPPLRYDATDTDDAARARGFNTWLKGEWLAGYNSDNPGYNNVAVFDWFDVLAFASNSAVYPNRLHTNYHSGDSHPNSTANATSTYIFATCPTNFIDAAWAAFTNQDVDADTMPDWWEKQYFPNLTTMTSTSDSDGDEFLDVDEFRAGTHATNGASFLGFTNAFEFSAAQFVVRWYSVDGKHYSIQRSTNLSGGFAPLDTNLPATAPLNVYTDAVDGVGSAFYRVQLD